MVTSPQNRPHAATKAHKGHNNNKAQQQQQQQQQQPKQQHRTPKGSKAAKNLQHSYATPTKQQQQQHKPVSKMRSAPTTPLMSIQPTVHASRNSSTPSPKGFFAETKRRAPPTPDALPKPPTMWTGKDKKGAAGVSGGRQDFAQFQRAFLEEQKQAAVVEDPAAVTQHLKFLLNVQG